MAQADSSVLAVPAGRSGCPVNLTLELMGDRWSMLLLRDLAFGGPSHYRELLAGSTEGIATNVLSARLSKLTEAGMLSRRADPTHAQRFSYCLTEPAIEFVPVLVSISAWASTWLPADPRMTGIARALHAGGDDLMSRFMDELRQEHLAGHPTTPTSLRVTLAADPS
jgi:DNA-binding HxlR family transcriptional regulator